DLLLLEGLARLLRNAVFDQSFDLVLVPRVGLDGIPTYLVRHRSAYEEVDDQIQHASHDQVDTPDYGTDDQDEDDRHERGVLELSAVGPGDLLEFLDGLSTEVPYLG